MDSDLVILASCIVRRSHAYHQAMNLPGLSFTGHFDLINTFSSLAGHVCDDKEWEYGIRGKEKLYIHIPLRMDLRRLLVYGRRDGWIDLLLYSQMFFPMNSDVHFV